VIKAAVAMAHVIEHSEYGDDISTQRDDLVYAVRALTAPTAQGET
jgi:hypothetical protein